MPRTATPARIAFALGMIGLGVLILRYGGFALGWPAWLPWHAALARVVAGALLVGGAGLLVPRTAPLAARLLLAVVLACTALRVPTLVRAPLVEVNWLAVGEIAVLAAGAWALFAADARARLAVRLMFAGSLIAFGLSHFFYTR